MPLWKKRPGGEVDFTRLPRHVAIIMDGNGRWAKRRGLPRTAGHAAGAENFRTIATYCKEIGLEAHWFIKEGYRHEWRFWDLAIQEALDFFGLTERGGNPY